MAWFTAGVAARSVQDARSVPPDRHRSELQAAGGRFIRHFFDINRWKNQDSDNNRRHRSILVIRMAQPSNGYDHNNWNIKIEVLQQAPSGWATPADVISAVTRDYGRRQ